LHVKLELSRYLQSMGVSDDSNQYTLNPSTIGRKERR